MRNMTNKCIIYRYVHLLHINRAAPYVLKPPIVAIYREVFFEGYITQNSKTMQYTNIKSEVFNKSL